MGMIRKKNKKEYFNSLLSVLSISYIYLFDIRYSKVTDNKHFSIHPVHGCFYCSMFVVESY